MISKAYPPRKAPTGFLAGNVEPAAALTDGEVEKLLRTEMAARLVATERNPGNAIL